MQSETKRGALVIDAAYFMQCSQSCSQKHKFTFEKCERSFLFILQVIQELCEVSFREKTWLTAEHPHRKHEQIPFYEMLAALGFEVDIRQYKKIDCYCPNRSCPFNQKAIKRPVQAEVDIAIAIKLVELSLSPEIDDIVLVAGDRDFKDALKFIGQRKKVHLVCFEHSIHPSLQKAVKNVIPLDDIWMALKYQTDL